jgi:hypothetical protein
MLTFSDNRSGMLFTRHLSWVCLCILALMASVWPSKAASLQATLERNQVQVGETVVLTLEFEGGQPNELPQLPEVPNLRMSSAGTSRNVSIINGRMSSSLTWSVEVTPLQPGDYTIPPFDVQVNGQRLSSPALKLKADPQANATSGDAAALMRIVLPKTEAYAGEALAVELQVFVRDGIANAEHILQYFENLGATPLKADGFSIIRTAPTGRRRAQAGQVQYVSTGVMTALVPVRPGTLKLEAAPVELVIQIPSSRTRRDPFARFGMFQQLDQRKMVLTAEPQVIQILPLPASKAQDFTGGIGQFTLQMTATPTNVAAGDPVTLKIQVVGKGSLESLNLPALKWDGFKFYPPTSKVDFNDQLGIEGSKVFEQVVVPQTPDVQGIPPLSFTYFDPERKAFQTLTHPGIPLVVRPASSRNAALPETESENEDQPQARDIVHIKQRPGTLARIGPPLLVRPSFISISLFPIAVWASACVWRRRAVYLQNNPRLRRQRQVERLVKEGLAELINLAARNEPQEFFATVFRLMQEQLGERLDLPAASITEAVLDEHLRPKGVSEPIINAARELFNLCNVARYAPVSGSQELSALIPKVRSIVEQLRGLKL